jgi:phosphate transport system permease protein
MTSVIPAPSKPWQPTFIDKLEDLLVIVGSLGAAGATVKLTGLNGKLGFFFSFFFILLIASFVFHFIKRGMQAAKDSVLKVLTAMAIVVTLIPIVSIVATVVSKG